jgi:hypothetical protein
MVNEHNILLSLHQNLPTIYSKIKSAKCAVLLDIDETVLSCMKKWKEYVKSELNIQLSLKQIKEAGSVDDIFLKTPLYSGFSKWAEIFRNSKEFNSKLPAVEKSQKAIQEISKIRDLKLGGYLTARPSNILKATSSNLRERRFPSLKIIDRSTNTPYLSSVQWKLEILKNLRDIYNGLIIMIDDSVDLALEIEKLNDKNKYIVSVLLKTPYNHNKIQREAIVTKSISHLYVANWSKVPSICGKYALGAPKPKTK